VTYPLEVPDLGQLQEFAERYCYPEIHVNMHSRQYRLQGLVKAPDSITGETPAAEVRMALLRQADRLLDDLKATGWSLDDTIMFTSAPR
jgi:hypothetical protein